MQTIQRVAIIGGGIMGTNIAAFFVNLGMICDLYDLDMNILHKNLEKLKDSQTKTSMLYSQSLISHVIPHATAEIAKYLCQSDWILEVVPEKMELKKSVLQDIAQYRRPGTLVTTNTSGLSIQEMAECMPSEMAQYFLGTHFFNPVRYLPLIEIIPQKATNPNLTKFCYEFFYNAGKKPILCKDTPNFVANRIGIFAILKALHLMEKYQFDVETIDLITGPILGNPKSATLRLCDIVGLDTIAHAAANVYEHCVSDEARNVFLLPDFVQRMLDAKMYGDKTGRGFYQKKDGNFFALNYHTMQYHPLQYPKYSEVQTANANLNIRDRIRAICKGPSPIQNFCRELVLSTAAYGLARVREISDDIVTIDRAMKYGFNRELGPIEILDAIGIEDAIVGMQEFGIPRPVLLKQIMQTTGKIYHATDTEEFCFDPDSYGWQILPKPKNCLNLAKIRKESLIAQCSSARLLDLQDGVLLLELEHPKLKQLNPIEQDTLDFFQRIPELVEQKGYHGLVIGSQAENFCTGIQLAMILELVKAKKWDQIAAFSSRFQAINMAFHHASFPIVVAPYGLTLGSGFELALAAHKRLAWTELYAGLTEANVGLIPGAAGSLLLLKQIQKILQSLTNDPIDYVHKTWEFIALSQISGSAYEAMEKGILSREDQIVYNKDEQMHLAKQCVLEIGKKHQPIPVSDLLLPGKEAYSNLVQKADEMVAKGQLGKHGGMIAQKLAYLLTGAFASEAHLVSESTFLEMEREIFVQLCAEPKTQERMEYMLQQKKPLSN